MPRSMTGFGSAEGPVLGGRVRIDIRTVNHRYFNPQLKLPGEFVSVESDLRERLRQLLERGHVAVTARWVAPPPADAGGVGARRQVWRSTSPALGRCWRRPST
ncbi:MAG: YicC/YloC family endoribonuclease [Gemmatimonadales bacterium]